MFFESPFNYIKQYLHMRSQSYLVKKCITRAFFWKKEKKTAKNKKKYQCVFVLIEIILHFEPTNKTK